MAGGTYIKYRNNTYAALATRKLFKDVIGLDGTTKGGFAEGGTATEGGTTIGGLLLKGYGAKATSAAGDARRASIVSLTSRTPTKIPTAWALGQADRQWAFGWVDFVPPQVISVDAGLVSASGTAYTTPNLIKPQAGLVSATGTAYDVAVNIKVQAGLATQATATAYNPTVTAFGVSAPDAGLVSATGTAYNTTASVKPQAGLVSATGTAYTVAVSLKVQAGLASASGTAYNPTITAFGVVSVDAGLVSASGTAYNVGSINIKVSAGLASASGTAYDTPNLVKPNAGLATQVTATAYDATITATQEARPDAGLVSATGTAHDATISLKPQATLASATGTAYTVGSITATVTTTGVASATATAYTPTITIKSSAELVSASATAYNVAVRIGAAPGVAQAVVLGTLAENTVGDDNEFAIYSGRTAAQTFKVESGSEVREAWVQVHIDGGPTNGDLAVALYATDGSGNPTGSTLTTGTLSGAGITDDPAQWHRIALSPYVTIPGATSYALVLSSTATEGEWRWRYDATGTYASGEKRTNVGAGWVNDNPHDFMFSVKGQFGATVSEKPSAELASASGTTYNPATSIKPNAGLASASGTAYNVGSITIAITAGLSQATGTAYVTPNLTQPTAGVAQATGTAYDATVDAYPVTNAPAGLATATATAYNPTITSSAGSIVAEPGPALATGTAYQVTISMGVQAGLATASATAYNASVSIRPQAEVAQATGDAHNAIKFNEAEPTAASATATGYDVAVSISVNAGAATQATATAYNASVVAYQVTLVDAGLASATGTAYDARTAIKPTAGLVSVSGTAYDPSVVAHPYVNVSAGLASATGSSYLASITVKPQPGLASSTGTAYLALISLQPAAGAVSVTTAAYNPTVADATGSGYGSATATAQAPALGLAINASVASAIATAHDATVQSIEYVRAPAGVAQATATAYQVARIVKEYDWPTASITIAARTLVVTVAGAVTLVPGTSTIAGQTLTVTPSLVQVNLGVATATYAAQALTVTPGTASTNLVAATTTAAPATLTPTNDISKLVDHHAAALGFQSIGQRTLIIPSGALDDKDRPWAVRGYDRGFVATPVTTATVTIAAQDLTTTAGAASQNLGAATVTVAAIQFGLNGQEMDLPSAATVTLQGQTLVPQGGAISVTLDSAVVVTISARDLSGSNNPRLAPATVDITAQTMVPEILRGSISQFFPGPIQVFHGVLTTQNDALYTVPQGFFLMIKEITLQKVGVGATATRLWSVPLSQNTSTANAFMYDVPVVDYIDQKMDMVLSAGERLYARCAADGQVVCRIDGYLLSNKSLPTPRVFFRGLVSDAYAEVAVTDLSAVGMVKFISIANTTGTERTIDISTTISGIAPADSGAIRRSLAVPGNSSVFIPMSMVLKVSEALAVKADVGGALSLNISGATAPRSVAVLTKTEIRATNYAVNHMIPRDSIDYDSTTLWPDWLFDDSSYRALVTGDFQGTTDEIFRWAAAKWDINLDLIRAVAVQESAWDARTNGDGGLSFGLMQVKPSALGNVGTDAATVSSAWNVDYWCAWFRTVYDGKGKLWRDRPDLTNRAYTAGDLWGTVESWYTGVGPSEASAWYSANVRRYIEQRPWETDADFIHQVGNWAWV